MNESGIRGESCEPDGLDEFERQLIRALDHVDPPQGFAARVLESARDHAMPCAKTLPVRPRFAALRGRAWAGGTIAAVLVLGLLAGGRVHARHEREQAALVQQRFETAMRVTGHALDQTRAQLRSAGLERFYQWCNRED